MEELFDRINYEEWDSPGHTIPDEWQLDDSTPLHRAIEVFFAVGGYDFFKVVRPEKYADNWLDFVGSLYSGIVEGTYKSDGKAHKNPLDAEKRASLREQGVPEIFTEDINE